MVLIIAKFQILAEISNIYMQLLTTTNQVQFNNNITVDMIASFVIANSVLH